MQNRAGQNLRDFCICEKVNMSAYIKKRYMPMCASVFFVIAVCTYLYLCKWKYAETFAPVFPLLQDVLPVILTFYRKRQKDRTQRCGLDFFRIYAVNGKTRKTIRFERYGVLRLFGVSFQKCLAVCRENRVFDFFSCVRVYRMNNVSKISIGSFS